jgi:hypothetical protein
MSVTEGLVPFRHECGLRPLTLNAVFKHFQDMTWRNAADFLLTTSRWLSPALRTLALTCEVISHVFIHSLGLSVL